MNVIFYSSTIDEMTTEICKSLENSRHNVGLELHHSIGSLERRLRQPLNGIALVIQYVSTQDDLSATIALKEVLHDLPVILIMNKTGGEAMTKARLLRPRFIFGTDDNIEDMCLVFEKMLTRQSSNVQQ
jgi:hypothetical protein